MAARGELVHFRWAGAQVLEGLEAKTAATVTTLTERAANYARANHPYTDRHRDGVTSTIFAKPARMKGDHIFSVWGAKSPALFLEYGTVKMPAYPFLRPAADHAYSVLNFAGGAIAGAFHDSGRLFTVRP